MTKSEYSRSFRDKSLTSGRNLGVLTEFEVSQENDGLKAPKL